MKKKFKKINWLILVVFIVVVSSICFSNAENNVDEKQIVKVGWYNYPGFQNGEFYGGYSGYNYEYLRKISEYTGWQYEFVYEENWKDSEKALIDGKIDILGGILYSKERETNLYKYPKYQVGGENAYLVSKKDDDRFFLRDYKKIDGKKIVMFESDVWKKKLFEKLQQYGVDVQIEYCSTQKEVMEKLNSGYADLAFIHDNSRRLDVKIIDKWENQPMYFVVNKNKPALLKKLNNALGNIIFFDSNYNDNLYKKYFKNAEYKSFTALTQDELNYLKKNPKVNICFNTENYPLSMAENDKLNGVIKTYFDEISKRTGIDFNYIKKDKSVYSIDEIKQNDIDIVPAITDTKKVLQTTKAYFTGDYLEVPYGIVYKVENSGNIKTLAVPTDFFVDINVVVQEKYTLKYYNSFNECLEAVLNDDVDSTIINSYYYEKIVMYSKYDKLQFKLDSRFNHNICIAISKEMDPMLYQIITKTMGDISTYSISEMVANSTVENLNVDFVTWVKMHTSFVIIIFLIVLIICLLIFLQYYRNLQRYKYTKKIKASNEKLERAIEQIELANKYKNDFLSRMSHDMRTPMNAIISISDFGVEETQDENLFKYFVEIKNSSKYLLELLNDILDMQKMENGQIELKKEVFNLNVIFDEIYFVVKNKLKEKQMTFNIEKNNIEKVYISNDKIRIKQILINILNNAIKYTPEKGNINWIGKVIVEQQKIQYTIEDNGVGMSEKFQKNMFDPFTREKNELTSSEEGTGLGLAITKKIIEEMQGSIDVFSKKNKGTKVVITLPIEIISKENAELINKEILEEYDFENEKAINLLKGKKILVCEDVSINAKIIKKILESKGIIVTIAKNGEEGIKKAKKNNFDAIIMDIRMPVIDGLTATKEIRLFNKNIPIIALSANAYNEDIEKSINAGMDEHLSKPIDKKRLFKVLNRC